MGVLLLVGTSLAAATSLAFLPGMLIGMAFAGMRLGGVVTTWRSTFAIGAMLSALAYDAYIGDRNKTPATTAKFIGVSIAGGGLVAGGFRAIGEVV
jgi:hypothetical protein